MRLLIIKIFLTFAVGIALTYPFVAPSGSGGVLTEVEALGIGGAIAIVTLFLLAIFFYCRDLQRILELISPASRSAEPRSVWLMFLLPYNFIEDFFIMYNIS